MSGAYFAQTVPGDDPRALAQLLSSQIAFGGEQVNHFAVSSPAAMGLVSPDNLKQGVMPRYLHQQQLWGVHEGELYASDFLDIWRQAHPDIQDDLSVFAEMYRGGSLRISLPHLNGAFFFLLWDPETQTLVAANDRFGMYPMYWAQRGERFCLASRVLCSVLSGASTGEWNTAAVANFLTIDDFLGEATLVRDVEAFPQATLLIKHTDKLQWERYWRYDYTPRKAGTRLDALGHDVGEKFVHAVKRQCARKNAVGITLSGGLDSRCILAATAKLGIPVNTYTWGNSRCFDRLFAKDAAAHFGSNHHDVEYDYDGFAKCTADGARVAEGLVNVFDFHMLAHLSVMAGKSSVILNGFAGDLVLGGSFLRPAWLKAPSSEELARLLYAWRNTLLPESALSSAMPAESIPSSDGLAAAQFVTFLDNPDKISTPDLTDRFFLENRERRMIAMGTVLTRCAVESAASFFDYDLIDLTTAVPAELRYEHGVYRAMMETVLPDTLKIRWQRTLLPAGAPPWMVIGAKGFLKGCRILEKRIGWPRIASRQSPVDLDRRLRNTLRPWMERICRDPHPASESVLRHDFCERVWQEQLAGNSRARLLGVIAAIREFGVTLDRARAKTPSSNVAPTEVQIS